MRALLIGTCFLSLVALPLTAQTDKERNRGSSQSELEHQQLRDLLAAQSSELEAMRERMRQLQQRMELLEAQLRAQNNPPATKESGGAPVVSETRDPGPIRATVALPARRETLEGGSRADAKAKGQESESDGIELANEKVRIGTLLYAD